MSTSGTANTDLCTDSDMDWEELPSNDISLSAQSAATSSTLSCSSSSVTKDSPVLVGQAPTAVNDLGSVIREANGSWEKMRSVVQNLSDDRKMQYLSNHYKPSLNKNLHLHPVTKGGKTWNVSFQLHWLQLFPWLSYSSILSGGICRNCVLFPEQPGKGQALGQSKRPGVLVLAPYQTSYSKAYGKSGVLVCHENTLMHHRANERADLFVRNHHHSSERIDSRLLKQGNQIAEDNKYILGKIILAIEFLAKQGLPFRGHRDDKVDFATEKINRGNFIATLQLMAKSDPLLEKHLVSSAKNAKYTSNTIQNQILHILPLKFEKT